MIKMIIWTFLFAHCAFLFPVQIWWPELAAVVALLCLGVTSCANNNCHFPPPDCLLPIIKYCQSGLICLLPQGSSEPIRCQLSLAALLPWQRFLSFVLSFGFECATDSQYRDSYIFANLLFYKKTRGFLPTTHTKHFFFLCSQLCFGQSFITLGCLTFIYYLIS